MEQKYVLFLYRGQLMTATQEEKDNLEDTRKEWED